MSLRIGIIGLPNVGKSTLFNALTKKKVDISNYPFCTIEPNVGVVAVPDERLQRLAGFAHSKKIVPAIIEFVDIEGLVKGAAQGEGLGNTFLSHIKEVDAIVEVVRVFDDPDITHVNGALDPISDISIIEYELILKDLETIQKRMESLERDVRARQKGAEQDMALLKEWEQILKKGFGISSVPVDSEKSNSHHVLKTLGVLTEKPILYVFNISEGQIKAAWKPDEALAKEIGNSQWVAVCAKVESELSELEPQEKKEYLESFGVSQSGLDQLIRSSYKALDLITFFTTGEDETRAWTIPRGSLAPRAGRAIHSDFEEKFIRAEVINWQKLLEAGSWQTSREHGWLRTEGKTYVVKDGDVIEFRI